MNHFSRIIPQWASLRIQQDDNPCCLGAAVLLTMVLSWATALRVVHAIPVWDADIPDRQGQFTFFNSKKNGAFFGLPVGAADFDNDGLADLTIAPMNAPSGPDDLREKAGEVYVLRGTGTFIGAVDHSATTPETFPGLTILGARPGDFLGVEMFATADVNRDNIADLILGAQNYDGPEGNRSNCGGTFVILGGSGILADGSVLDLNFDPRSPPPGVITIFGEREGDRLGLWVEAGDFDGDGFDDLALGGDQSKGMNLDLDHDNVGMAAIIYGRDTFPSIIDLAEGPNNIPGSAFFYGVDEHDHFGSTLHGADINGDGQDELLISAALNRLSASYTDDPSLPARANGGGKGPDNKRNLAGEITIVFSDGLNGRFSGRIDFASSLPAELTGRVSVVYGSSRGEVCGEEIASADLDGDGREEIALGGLTARNPEGLLQAGVAYVMDGLESLKGSNLDLASPEDAPNELVIRTYYGDVSNMIFGDTMVGGDFNFDGIGDMTIGVPHTVDRNEPGQAVILYGSPEFIGDFTYPVQNVPQNTLDRTLITGPDGGDNFSYSLDAHDYDRDGYWDLVSNAMRGDGPNDDVINDLDVGEAHVFSGYHFSGISLSLDSLVPAGSSLGETTQVTLQGHGFTTDSRVFVDGKEILDIEVVNGNKIIASFPQRQTPVLATVEIETRHASTNPGLNFSYDEPFVRGDTNNSGGLTIEDPLETLGYLYLSGEANCLDSHDVNDSGTIDITDPIRNLFFQFVAGSPPPAAPYPAPGLDTTQDSLGCMN